jgi:hypothetical protein
MDHLWNDTGKKKKKKLMGEMGDCSISPLFFTNPPLAGMGFKPL